MNLDQFPETNSLVKRHTSETAALPMNPPLQIILDHCRRQALELVQHACQLERRLHEESARLDLLQTLKRDGELIDNETGKVFSVTHYGVATQNGMPVREVIDTIRKQIAN